MTARSRRTTSTTLQAAPTAVAAPKVDHLGTNVNATGSTIRVIKSNSQLRLAEVGTLQWLEGVAPRPGYTIEVFPDMTFQQMRGFGVAATGGFLYNLRLMKRKWPQKYWALLRDFTRLGIDVYRLPIGSCDFDRKVRNNLPGKLDDSLSTFNIRYDKKYLIPILRDILKVNPNARFIAVAWSPPPQFTNNDSMLGGTLERTHIDLYAKFLAMWVKAYRDEGIKIDDICTGNEVGTTQDRRMPQCSLGQEAESALVWALRAALDNLGLNDVGIWIIDHNPDNWGRAMSMLEGGLPIRGIAWHPYVGDLWRMAYVHDAYPQFGARLTEGTPDLGVRAFPGETTRWATTSINAVVNRCDEVVYWNGGLDQDGKPRLGPFFCGGFVEINSKTGEVIPSGQYFGLAHLSLFVRTGATVIETLSRLPNLEHAGFVNPDGSMVLVISNRGFARSITIRLNGKVVSLDLDADAAYTLVWK